MPARTATKTRPRTAAKSAPKQVPKSSATGAGRAAPKRAAPGAARRSARPAATGGAAGSIPERVASALAWLERKSTARDRANFERFGIAVTRAYGVSMANLQVLARQLGRDHELAAALWDAGWHESRMLATLVDEPSRVTPAQMDRWCREFDNWAICDTACFCLFDRSPHAWSRIAPWSEKRGEQQKRAAFALLACLALHDKSAADAPFLDGLRRVERAATDERNFVKKGVNWALRSIGRRNAALHAAAVKVAERLAASPEAAPRWVGKDALRELTSPAVLRKLGAREKKPKR